MEYFSVYSGLIILLMYLIPILFSIISFVGAVFFVRWVLGIRRFLSIAEENLELNRRRAAHAEKSAAMLVAIRDRLDQPAGHDSST